MKQEPKKDKKDKKKGGIAGSTIFDSSKKNKEENKKKYPKTTRDPRPPEINLTEKKILGENQENQISEDMINQQPQPDIQEEKKCLFNKKLVIILSIVGVILIGVITFAIIKYLRKEPVNPKPKEEPINPGSEKIPVPIKNEFDIKTEVGLRTLSLIQNSAEKTKFNSTDLETDVKRKTNYLVYFTSKEKPPEPTYYSEMYTGVVAIESECAVVDGKDCEPKPLVDLRSKSNNLRLMRLLSSEDLKDIPIPICKFNMTDNHIITTLICPETLPDNKRNEIILDLYFFRPPAAERVNKERDNITLTITEEGDQTKIHETNGGFCNLYNNWGSQCTTDMNTVLDKEGNLVSYDEQAITTINYDEKNSYKKDKTTKLIDTSSTLKKSELANYEKTLKDLLQKIEPYMKEEIQFDQSEYEDLYNMIKEAKNKDSKSTKEYVPKKERNTFRYLNYELDKDKHSQLYKIFSSQITPVQIDLNFKINPGLNSDKMGIYLVLQLDDKEYPITTIEESFDIQALIDKLSNIAKSGNYLASELNNKIYDLLEKLINATSIQINSLDELILYYDLYEIFNSTLIEISYRTLPYGLIDLSEQLVNALKNVFDNIRTGNIKPYADLLHEDIYNYIHDLHTLISTILNNLSALSNILISKENLYTRITNYYLNNTYASYYNIIYRIQSILETYFVKEYEKIYPKITELMLLLELNSDEALKDELESLRNLYNSIKNKEIEIYSATEPEVAKVLSNLDRALIYPTDIIKEIQKYLNEIMDKKENGFLTSDKDIKDFADSFKDILEEAKEVAKKLENVDMIDFVFDEIMIKFREGYIYTIKLMEELKSGNFTLDEDILKETLFSKNERAKMEKDLKDICDEMLNKIINEKEIYIKKIHYMINLFLSVNIDVLNDKIYELVVILSEEVLYDIQHTFETYLNSTLDKIAKIIKDNTDLSREYFDRYYIMVTDEYVLKQQLLYAYLYNFGNTSYEFQPYQLGDFIRIDDKLEGAIKRTSSYISKYNKFIENYDDSLEYLKEHLYLDLNTEYREIFTNIKEELQTIIDNKLSEKYKVYGDFEFFDKHIKIIDELKTRIDKYFSLRIFEEKYLGIIYDSINKNIQLITEEKNYINNKHENIKEITSYRDDSKDLCVSFYRKVCYGCTNCVENTYFFDNYCFDIAPYKHNYLIIKKLDYDTINDFGQFRFDYNRLNARINEQVNSYNSIVVKFSLNISIIIEQVMNERITNNYLQPLTDWIDAKMSQKLENSILNATYTYYKSTLDTKLQNIFTDVFKQWEKIYKTLAKDIRKNEDGIKYSMFEFTHMSEIYKTIIETDLMENYYNSIIIFEKSQLDYAISYYYSYFSNLINKYYKYVIQKIPTNGDVYDDRLAEKQLELKNYIEEFNNKIAESQNKYLDEEYQIKILKNDESDFFKNKYMLTDKLIQLNDTLEDIIDEISLFETFLPPGDEYSLVMRYYLENKELGKLFEKLYEPIDNGKFFDLDLKKFKNIVSDNWIFDKENFVNILNNILYETGSEIKKELNVKLQDYILRIQNELKDFFSGIEKVISDLFKNAINSLTSSQKDIINNIVSELISEFESKMKSEATRFNPNTYNSNSEKIQNYFNNYKTYIKNKVENSIFELLDKFKDNAYTAIYSNYVEKKTITYLESIKTIISKLGVNNYKLLNSTLNIGEVMIGLVETVIHNYKLIIEKTISNRYVSYYEKIKLELNLEAVYVKIDKDLDNIYEKVWLTKLQNKCTICQDYTISEDTTNYIENIISVKIKYLKEKIIIIKGNKVEVNTNINIDIKISSVTIFESIFKSLKSFLSFENEEQVDRINLIIQNVIKSNLEDFLTNIIPIYGNIFFERIIDYNINFKIVNLYENFHYAISKTLLYYHALRVINDNMNDLPFDLKIRLYRLNDLDITILNKVEDIKELAEVKLTELIRDLRNETKNVYLSLTNDEAFRSQFSIQILEKIDENLKKIMPDLEKTYQKVLEKYLKEKFLKAFSDILDEKTEYMLKVFYEEKKKLIERLDSLFSSKEDKDLNEVNKNINITLESIRTYRKFLSKFKISDEVIQFFGTYSENNLVPIYKKFFLDIKDKKDEEIMEEINKRTYEIENLNAEEYSKRAKEVLKNLFDNYFDIIKKAIENYGNTESNYRNHLEKAMEEERDKSDEQIVKMESKYVEDNLNRLVSKAKNVRQFIVTLPALTDTENKIKESKYKLSIDFKDLRFQISKFKFNDKIIRFLTEKLINVTNSLNNFYDSVNSEINELKINIIDAIFGIKSSLDNVLEITSTILNSKYKAISDSTERINKKKENYIEEYDEEIKYIQKTENMMTTVLAFIEKLTEYGEFILEFDLLGDKFKYPKIKSTIIDKTIPKDVNIVVGSEYSFCYIKSYDFDIYLNDGSFTSILEYDTKSSVITISTYTDIEKYKYDIKFAENKGELNSEVIDVENYFYKPVCKNIVKNITAEMKIEEPHKSVNTNEPIIK